MEDYRLEQSGQEVQDILNGAAMQSDLTAETERATEAEQTLQGNIDIEERERKAADLTLQGNIDAEEIRAKAAEKQNADDIDALEEKVPSGASSSNKLATEEYVDDSVATATATFRGTYNLVSDLHLTVYATEQQIATALALAISTADNNDYCFILVPTSSETPTEIQEIDRYKFNGMAWSFEYKLNNSGFTAAQWAAINSGITSGDVSKLAALPTNAQLTTLLAGKQDVLTFDNVPTQGSSHPVKSGGVYSAISDEKTARENADSSLSSAIEAILLLIPSAATSLNKLADKAFVNSSIATASATFRGTYNLVTDLSLTVSATHAQIATALAGAVSDEDNNDYAFVQIPTSDATPTQIAKTERYKYNGTIWEYEYDLNNSGYTAAQWAAINSGITEALVTKLSALPTNAELTSALGVLTSSITTINQKIPSAASQANQLVDTAAMESYIVQVLDVLTASFNVTSSDGHVTVSISQVDGKITSVSVSTSDIASAASLSLVEGRVTTAEGNISTNASDIANLQDAYAALTQSALVIVQPTDTWPVASPATSTIYRVVDRVNTPPQNYSDYMWNGTTMVLMAEYDNAIDDEPIANSNNLVKSGGVEKKLSELRAEGGNTSYFTGNAENAYDYVINENVVPGRVYRLRLCQTDWSMASGYTDQQSVFSFGYLTNVADQSTYADIMYIPYGIWKNGVRPESEYIFKVPYTAKAIRWGGRASDGVKVKFVFEDVTDEYSPIQNLSDKNLPMIYPDVISKYGEEVNVGSMKIDPYNFELWGSVADNHTFFRPSMIKKGTVINFEMNVSAGKTIIIGFSKVSPSAYYTDHSTYNGLKIYNTIYSLVDSSLSLQITAPIDGYLVYYYNVNDIVSKEILFYDNTCVKASQIENTFFDRKLAEVPYHLGGSFIYRPAARTLIYGVKEGEDVKLIADAGIDNIGSIILYLEDMPDFSKDTVSYSGERILVASGSSYYGFVPAGKKYMAILVNNGFGNLYTPRNLFIDNHLVLTNASDNLLLSDHFPLLCDVVFDDNNIDYTRLRTMIWNIAAWGIDSTSLNRMDTKYKCDTYLPRFKRIFNEANADIIGFCEFDPTFGHYTPEGGTEVVISAESSLLQNYQYVHKGTRVEMLSDDPAWTYQNAMFSVRKMTNPQEENFNNVPVKYFIVNDIQIGNRVVKVATTHLHYDSNYVYQPQEIQQIIDYFANDDYVIILADTNYYDFSAFENAGYAVANSGVDKVRTTWNSDDPSGDDKTFYIDNIFVKGGTIHFVNAIIENSDSSIFI